MTRSRDTCDRTPTRLAPPDVPELACPAREEIEQVRQEIPVQINTDVSQGVLVCRESEGSVDLTVVQHHLYQSLLFLRRMRFDRPLPWTDLPVYEWVRATIPSGIVVHATGNSRSCLDCRGPIELVYADYTSLRVTVVSLTSLLIVHEARHAQGWPHTCGRNPSYFNAYVRDTSVEEMGAYGVQYLLAYWLGHYSDEAPEVREYFRNLAAKLLGQGLFCCECRG